MAKAKQTDISHLRRAQILLCILVLYHVGAFLKFQKF